MKMKEIRTLTPAEAGKKLEEVEKAYLELEPTSMKRKPLRKDIARIKTYLHQKQMESGNKEGKKGMVKPAEQKKETKKPEAPKPAKKAATGGKKSR